MNSTLSDSTSTITPPLSPSTNANVDMGYSSLTIGIIVLCVVSGLVVAALCIFLFIKRQRTSNALVENEKQHDETSEWRIWSSSPPLAVTAAADSRDRQDNHTHKTNFASFLLPRKTKKVSTVTASSTMLDDIPLPTPLSAPAPTATTTLSKWKQDQQTEKRSPIVFEEGYDPKALLRTSYHHSSQQHQHPLPSTMITNPPLPPASSPLNDGSLSSVDDPCLLDSLERQKHINDIYYRATPTAATSTTTFHRHHRSSPSWGSSTVIQSPGLHAKYINSNNNSSLLSLSMAEKLEQDAELQRLSISSYHVW